jgi:hypothetical protein
MCQPDGIGQKGRIIIIRHLMIEMMSWEGAIVNIGCPQGMEINWLKWLNYSKFITEEAAEISNNNGIH